MPKNHLQVTMIEHLKCAWWKFPGCGLQMAAVFRNALDRGRVGVGDIRVGKGNHKFLIAILVSGSLSVEGC